jgi:hypothetical protein
VTLRRGSRPRPRRDSLTGVAVTSNTWQDLSLAHSWGFTMSLTQSPDVPPFAWAFGL